MLVVCSVCFSMVFRFMRSFARYYHFSHTVPSISCIWYSFSLSSFSLFLCVSSSNKVFVYVLLFLNWNTLVLPYFSSGLKGILSLLPSLPPRKDSIYNWMMIFVGGVAHRECVLCALLAKAISIIDRGGGDMRLSLYMMEWKRLLYIVALMC